MSVLNLVSLSILCIVTFASPLLGQPQQSKPERDIQSIEILQRVVQTAGGSQAVAAVRDITEKGEAKFFWGPGVKGPVMIEMLRSDFRLKTSLPDEKITWLVGPGVASYTKGGTTKPLPPAEAANLPNLTYPVAHIAAALSNLSSDISFVGIEKRDGRPHYRIRVTERLAPSSHGNRESVSRDLLIDANTFDIAAIEDHPFPTYRIPSKPKEDITAREIDFADFRAVLGLRVPFSTTSKVHGQELFQIRLSEVSFNSGLTEELFKGEK